MFPHPSPRFIAVVDIGKTNAKLVVHDLAERTDRVVASQPNRVLTDGPYPHADADGLWAFLLDGLARAAAQGRVDALSITTHGAAAALVDGDVDGDGLVLPILDYESPLPDDTTPDYDRLRPAFADSGSPPLPGGLNLGRQVFWLQRRFPDAFAKARHILTYPQYWAWRLSGVAASEATSLGCHTDLWEPAKGGLSALVDRAGWRGLFPPLRSAFDALGPLRPEIAARVGLGPIPVHCGIHDSNASLLPHILARPAPLSVVSTGTWIIALAVGGSLAGLDPARDALANVDALGRPVPSARFMGGRVYDRLTNRDPTAPSDADLDRVLTDAITVHTPDGAPDRWSHDPASLTPGERAAAASLRCALTTAAMLDTLRADGPTIVEGPFARNRLFLRALAARTGRPVAASPSATGTSAGAARLALPPTAPAAAPPDHRMEPPDPALAARLTGYASDCS
ncbi:FGGY-family carbohydrate kinase [Azospirillum griseum]|uniref:Carbohydrate kinase n=1 Tax=Azospirillum griseum TaxID=2496639 RepID=A0A431VFD3_9PROT|nr:FGGY family carbohydrate kinase [Azospirillum griseum]RTR18867.1 carbohydrate kinase [Azospirillum griseum]